METVAGETGGDCWEGRMWDAVGKFLRRLEMDAGEGWRRGHIRMETVFGEAGNKTVADRSDGDSCQEACKRLPRRLENRL